MWGGTNADASPIDKLCGMSSGEPSRMRSRKAFINAGFDSNSRSVRAPGEADDGPSDNSEGGGATRRRRERGDSGESAVGERSGEAGDVGARAVRILGGVGEEAEAAADVDRRRFFEGGGEQRPPPLLGEEADDWVFSSGVLLDVSSSGEAVDV